ncbi:glycine zipper 2TM domain-containing protein [Methylocaldum sp.]|uniref:glycine zipper 2TM domain-containing protein n=1 Tax=Methylocaldum sp. TaxID=1969727 RepID=UPI002D523A81|nr:glycine zipper 2TM domain-containing protein [Methylocaldum sp.]HYE37367.1 glycine zipper 2TM domain-containing protein [Methylocaldum sp.]
MSATKTSSVFDTSSSFVFLSAIFLAFILIFPQGAYSDPPDWAPAHGYRNKHKDKHHDRDYYDDRYEHRETHHYHDRDHDYGVRSGRCDRTMVGKVLGGVAGGALGGVIGSRVGNGDTGSTIIGAVAGTVIGAIIGDRIARGMDANDMFCTGRVLDFADDRRSVHWMNPENQVDYLVTPLRTFNDNGGRCREFSTRMTYGNQRDSVNNVACRQPDGSWLIRN